MAKDDVNAPVIAVVGLLGVLVVFAIILLLQVVFYHVQARQAYEKDISVAPPELAKLVADEQAKLSEYRWVDKEKKVAAVPIGRAMELVVKELSQSEKSADTGPATKRPAGPSGGKGGGDAK